MGWWDRLGSMLGVRLNRKDRNFVEENLDPAGRFLFSQMSIIDQRHTLRVARYIKKKAAFQRGIDFKKLIQAALLHDAGKVKGEIKWFHRILVAIIRRLFPRLREKWGIRNKSFSFRYALYVDLIHPSRGAYMAESLGLAPEIVSLIRRHHDPPSGKYEPELALLQEADRKN